VARSIVQKFKGTKKDTAPLKVDLPAELKTRLDIVVAAAGESLKDYVTVLVSRAVEAEERKRMKKEQVA
jgi:hypothetical protein